MTPSRFSVSPEDSRRFTLKVVRGVILDDSPDDDVVTIMRTMGADIVIFRCPAGNMAQIRNLMRHGYTPIHADTLVYYKRSLRNELPPRVEMDSVDSSHAMPSEQHAISEIARLGFSGYRSHYLANPLLNPRLVLDGYVEWAQAHLAAQDPNKETWVVRVAGRPCGFATCAIDPGSLSVEVVLNAVAPEYMGQGLYGHLLNSIILHYSTRGLSTLLISTQIWNYVVQRAWSRAGLTLDSALDTYHVNAISPAGGK